MNQRLQNNIANNIDLYDAVFTGLGVPFFDMPDIWYSLEDGPPLYSNIITKTREWRPDETFESINHRFESERWKSWSIKDSFSVLDLVPFGFEKLFEAKWIYLEKDLLRAREEQSGLVYQIAKSESDLTDWRIGWEKGETVTSNSIFGNGLLQNPDLFFIAGIIDVEIVCGCLVNRSDHVLGISNFFSEGTCLEYWNGITKFVFKEIGKQDIVGYESDSGVLTDISTLGFQSIGNLSIWKKDASPL